MIAVAEEFKALIIDQLNSRQFRAPKDLFALAAILSGLRGAK